MYVCVCTLPPYDNNKLSYSYKAKKLKFMIERKRVSESENRLQCSTLPFISHTPNSSSTSINYILPYIIKTL